MCTYIYFAYIGSLDGDEMSPPLDDPGVDPDYDQDMANVDDQAGTDRPGPHVTQVPTGVRHRPDTRFRMELGNQLCRLLVEEGVRPTTIREIKADDRLATIWRGMPHDMLTQMYHVVGATSLVARLRRVVRCRHGGDVVR